MRLKKGIISIVLILAVVAGGLSVNQEKVQASDAPTKMEIPIRNIRLYP